MEAPPRMRLRVASPEPEGRSDAGVFVRMRGTVFFFAGKRKNGAVTVRCARPSPGA